MSGKQGFEERIKRIKAREGKPPEFAPIHDESMHGAGPVKSKKPRAASGLTRLVIAIGVLGILFTNIGDDLFSSVMEELPNSVNLALITEGLTPNGQMNVAGPTTGAVLERFSSSTSNAHDNAASQLSPELQNLVRKF